MVSFLNIFQYPQDAEPLPLKQGLKHIIIQSEEKIDGLDAEPLPLKQGLKLVVTSLQLSYTLQMQSHFH